MIVRCIEVEVAVDPDRAGTSFQAMTLRRALASAALSTVLLVAVAGCSNSDSDSSPKPGTDVGQAVSVVPTTDGPATTEAPATTTTLPAPTGAETESDAARTLYDAWTNNDPALAATVAEPEAIDVIWTATPGPYELYRNCDDGEFDTGGCLFRDRSTNNTIQINLEKRDGRWVVVTTFFSEG